MTTPAEARPRGLVTLYRIVADETERKQPVGTEVKREAIDAREMLATGAWSLTPLDAAPVTALPAMPDLPPSPVAPVASRTEDVGPARPVTVVPEGRTATGAGRRR